MLQPTGITDLSAGEIFYKKLWCHFNLTISGSPSVSQCVPVCPCVALSPCQSIDLAVLRLPTPASLHQLESRQNPSATLAEITMIFVDWDIVYRSEYCVPSTEQYFIRLVLYRQSGQHNTCVSSQPNNKSGGGWVGGGMKQTPEQF